MTCFWHMHEFLHWKLDAYAVSGGCKIEIPHFPLLILYVGEEGSISFYIEGNCRICSRPEAVVAVCIFISLSCSFFGALMLCLWVASRCPIPKV